MPGNASFAIPLPRGYRKAEPLAYFGRDERSPTERVDGSVIRKTLHLGGHARTIAVHIDAAEARCTIVSDRPASKVDSAAIRDACERMLGLRTDPKPFERRARNDALFGPLVRKRPGLRIPMVANPWEALSWAIIGQQIKLAFACALRRDLTLLAGLRAEDGGVAFPDAGAIARLDVGDLRRIRFSGSKAAYLIGAAQAVETGALPLQRLDRMPYEQAVEALRALRGVGVWTANYALMRGTGMPDCAPIGDAGVAAALRLLCGLDAKPDAAAVDALLQPYAPYRSLAVAHLWASLHDER